MVKRGDVWWSEHPTAGRRPALVLTRNEAIGVLNKVLVVPATGRRRGISTEVTLDVDDGMPEPCVLTLDNMLQLSKGLLIEPITTLSEEKLRDVCVALARSVSCESAGFGVPSPAPVIDAQAVDRDGLTDGARGLGLEGESEG